VTLVAAFLVVTVEIAVLVQHAGMTAAGFL
jgi:hypothetical protein